MEVEMYKELQRTEVYIKEIKDTFQERLARNLNLIRVSAPLIVDSEKGLNDNLNGWERAVGFDVLNLNGSYEVPQSLAKWKRVALSRYGFEKGSGLYTDMNGIRRDDELDELHSIYVDQWDWEKVIDKSERTEETLIKTVKKIFTTFKQVENRLALIDRGFEKWLPNEITFIKSAELEKMYPELSPSDREHAFAKEKGAIFVMQVGCKLASGEVHDNRAPDYDDWSLNGDILFWYPPLNRSIELSSMGIRVCEDSLEMQLKELDLYDERKNKMYHQAVLNKELPYTIGGGIGQSRICMYFLRKQHIGEVQVSVWPEEMIKENEEKGIILL